VTALGIAQLRASESRRPDALFHDPLADHFVVAAGTSLPWSGTSSRVGSGAGVIARPWSSLANYVAVRTRFFDTCLQDACMAGCRQVVILGAGLDARAFRLEWPEGTRIFELDQPDVLAFKEAVIARVGARPRCHRVRVATSLDDDWLALLIQQGFRANEPVAWLAEGLLIYLPEHVVDLVLRRVSQASPRNSRLALEHVSREHLERMRHVHARAGVSGFAAFWQSAVSGSPDEWLSRYGWRATVVDTREQASALHRPISDPDVGTSSWLISAMRVGADPRAL
jgi:methyltransferase (TIGR00027 family)